MQCPVVRCRYGKMLLSMEGSQIGIVYSVFWLLRRLMFSAYVSILMYRDGSLLNGAVRVLYLTWHFRLDHSMGISSSCKVQAYQKKHGM